MRSWVGGMGLWCARYTYRRLRDVIGPVLVLFGAETINSVCSCFFFFKRQTLGGCFWSQWLGIFAFWTINRLNYCYNTLSLCRSSIVSILCRYCVDTFLFSWFWPERLKSLLSFRHVACVAAVLYAPTVCEVVCGTAYSPTLSSTVFLFFVDCLPILPRLRWRLFFRSYFSCWRTMLCLCVNWQYPLGFHEWLATWTVTYGPILYPAWPAQPSHYYSSWAFVFDTYRTSTPFVINAACCRELRTVFQC